MRRATESSYRVRARSPKPSRLGGIVLGAVTAVATFATVVAAPVPSHTASPRVVATAPRVHATAPPAGSTGGFGEQSCAFCHIGSDVNAFGGSVRLEGVPAAYEAGREYVITVDLRADETAVAGFQLSARYAEGAEAGKQAGTFEPVDDRTAVSDSLGIAYVHHSEAGSETHDPSGARWSFSWVAPSQNENVGGAGIVFHVAANSGNGDNSPLGDLVYVAERLLPTTSTPRRPPSTVHPTSPPDPELPPS